MKFVYKERSDFLTDRSSMFVYLDFENLHYSLLYWTPCVVDLACPKTHCETCLDNRNAQALNLISVTQTIESSHERDAKSH